MPGRMGNGKNLGELRSDVWDPEAVALRWPPGLPIGGALNSPSCVLDPCAGHNLHGFPWWPCWSGLGNAGPHMEVPP